MLNVSGNQIVRIQLTHLTAQRAARDERDSWTSQKVQLFRRWDRLQIDGAEV